MPEKKIIISVGGSVERAVKGDYDINVKAVLTEAWQYTLQSRVSINLSLFLVLFFGMVVSFIASSFFGGIEVVIEDPQLLQIINKPTQTKMILSFLHRGSWVALCALLTSLLISIGFQLLIIPGVLLAVLLSLTVPLVVEKKLTPMQAIILSIKALRFKVMPLLSIYTVLFMALFSLVLPVALLVESTFAPIAIVVFLFGFSYLAPWYYNVKGILYRDIFGVFVDESTTYSDLTNTIETKPATKSTDHNDSDDTFSA